jgi:hypothetical protein
MSQVNVNPSGPPVREDSGDRAAAAGINFLTIVVVLAVVVALLWFLFSGPVGGLFRGTSDVNVNVNTPAQTQPSGPGTGTGGSSAPSAPSAPRVDSPAQPANAPVPGR